MRVEGTGVKYESKKILLLINILKTLRPSLKSTGIIIQIRDLSKNHFTPSLIHSTVLT